MKNKFILKIILLLIVLSMTFSNISSANDIENNESKVEVEYEYDEERNLVIAQISSNVELQDTKSTWTLSDDKKTYTKIYYTNQKYNTNIIDINGKITSVEIDIKDIKETKIEISYEYNKITGQVVATMTSNVELQDTKPTWKLSSDKLVYTKIFTSNMRYNTTIEDRYGKKIEVEINIDQIGKDKPNLKVNNVYDKTTNQVTSKIISDVPLKNTKPTWKLSEDRMTYTKVYSNNSNYSTAVEDIYGNVVNVKINFNDIDDKGPEVKVDLRYDIYSNTVTAVMKSNEKMANTKPTWELSEDQLTYTKIFSTNMNYNTRVEDLYGNGTNVNIVITKIDDKAPEITLEYKFNSDDTVTVYMKSNEKMANTKPTWKLSEDQLTYEKVFDDNKKYFTEVQDLYGNSKDITIDFKTKKFEYKQVDNSKIKVRYLYIGKSKVITEIVSSVKMQDTKPTWKLSKDGYTYSKEYYNNQMYKTYIKDINGKTKEVNIVINLFDNYLLGIDVSHNNGNINWEEVKKSGIDFVIIRVGYGQNYSSQDDRCFIKNISECERLGIPYGVYLYSYAQNVNNASSEADHMLRLIRGYNPVYGIWYDLEEENRNVDYVGIATTFCEKIKANGYNNVGIYASLSWFNSKLNDSRLDQYSKWVAQWGESCTYNKPYRIWQYTASGSINGINGNVDMDILYK